MTRWAMLIIGAYQGLLGRRPQNAYTLVGEVG